VLVDSVEDVFQLGGEEIGKHLGEHLVGMLGYYGVVGWSEVRRLQASAGSGTRACLGCRFTLESFARMGRELLQPVRGDSCAIQRTISERLPLKVLSARNKLEG